jgi:hypothetical protein
VSNMVWSQNGWRLTPYYKLEQKKRKLQNDSVKSFKYNDIWWLV